MAKLGGLEIVVIVIAVILVVLFLIIVCSVLIFKYRRKLTKKDADDKSERSQFSSRKKKRHRSPKSPTSSMSSAGRRAKQKKSKRKGSTLQGTTEEKDTGSTLVSLQSLFTASVLQVGKGKATKKGASDDDTMNNITDLVDEQETSVKQNNQTTKQRKQSKQSKVKKKKKKTSAYEQPSKTEPVKEDQDKTLGVHSVSLSGQDEEKNPKKSGSKVKNQSASVQQNKTKTSL